MHSYPSPQILPHKGKELSFLPLKCTTFLPCKSFPISNCLAQKYKAMGKESNFLFPPPCTAIPPHKSFSTWGRSQAFFPLQSYPSPQILPHMGKSQAFFCQNAKLSFPTNPSHSMQGKILPHNAELLQILHHKSIAYLFIFIFHLIFIYLFIYFFLLCFIFFSYFLKFLFNFLFFFAKLEILPQREKIIPQRLGQIIEEQTPLAFRENYVVVNIKIWRIGNFVTRWYQ